jgi:hypothetical protein
VPHGESAEHPAAVNSIAASALARNALRSLRTSRRYTDSSLFPEVHWTNLRSQSRIEVRGV